MRFRLTAIVGTDAACKFLRTHPPVCRCHSTFAMPPLSLNRLEPRALHGQPPGPDPYPVSCGFHPLIVPVQPGAYRVTLVPRGIIPDQDQGRATLRRQALTTPGQQLHGHRAHRRALHKPQQPLGSRRRGAAHQQPIPRQCLRGSILLGTLQGIQAGEAPRLDPAMRLGLGQSAPPDLIGKAQPPGWRGTRPAYQAVPTVFFRRYAGSGLVSQGLARFQRTPSGARAARLVSSLTRRRVSPCSQLTSAASARVHRLVALPQARGLWGQSPRSRARPSASKMAGVVCGLEDWGWSTARPRR